MGFVSKAEPEPPAQEWWPTLDPPIPLWTTVTEGAGLCGWPGWVKSTAMTLRQQGRDVLGYLVEATEATLRGGSPPSLLPNSIVLSQAKLSA